MCYNPFLSETRGWIPERPKGADCKSVVDDFEGSNPSPSSKHSLKTASVFFFSRETLYGKMPIGKEGIK